MAGSYISGDNHHHNHHQPNEHHQPILALTTTTNNKDIGDTWQVQYARFFNCPTADVSSSSDRHPSLIPQMKRIKGTWLSSFTSLAYLKLFTDCGVDDDSGRVVVTVTLVDHVVEEHYISKLRFTWPQVACLSGFPARGSKVVFMSYKDRVGQIHKFAVRFVTLYETERFINSVKEFFGHEKVDGSMSGISITRTSSQSEIIPRAPQDWDPISSSANFPQPMYRALQDWDPISSSADVSQPIYRPPQNEDLWNSSADFSQPMYRPPQNEDPVNSSADFSQPMYRPPQNEDPVNSSADFSQPMYRPTWEWSPIASTADTCIQSMQPSENHNGSQISNPLEATLSQDVQGKLSAFPPSFTSLLMDCFPAAEQEMQSTVPEEFALKKEIMKYLEDSSFHEMLSKIQKVVNGFEDDLLVQPVTTL